MGIDAEAELVSDTHIGARANVDAVGQDMHIAMVATVQIGDAAIVDLAKAIIDAETHTSVNRLSV